MDTTTDEIIYDKRGLAAPQLENVWDNGSEILWIATEDYDLPPDTKLWNAAGDALDYSDLENPYTIEKGWYVFEGAVVEIIIADEIKGRFGNDSEILRAIKAYHRDNLKNQGLTLEEMPRLVAITARVRFGGFIATYVLRSPADENEMPVIEIRGAAFSEDNDHPQLTILIAILKLGDTGYMDWLNLLKKESLNPEATIAGTITFETDREFPIKDEWFAE